MKIKNLLVEFYEPADDIVGQHKYDDTRRPKLTIRHLRKMRNAKDMAKVEDQDYKEFLPAMYNQTPAE